MPIVMIVTHLQLDFGKGIWHLGLSAEAGLRRRCLTTASPTSALRRLPRPSRADTAGACIDLGRELRGHPNGGILSSGISI